MGIAPIPGIRETGPAKAPFSEREVEPAFALTRTDRMQEDAYQGGQESEERGMEEDSEPAEDSNTDETASIPSDPNSRVSFFA
jgi:hypothetical protein